MKILTRTLAAVTVFGLLLGLMAGAHANAQTDNRDFSLQVTPSPLVATVKPGETKELELNIRNNGSRTEQLKIEARSFSYSSATEEVELKETEVPEVAAWLSYSNQSFTIDPGEWTKQKIKVTVPQTAGFSYSFAFIISRQNEPVTVKSGNMLKGSVAVFTLINIDRPDAKRAIKLATFSSAKRMYEYLPAEFSVKLSNNGNTIVQPYGNIFVQRGENDKTHISTLTVNDKRGYLLPESTRTFTSEWTSGFPVYTTTQEAANTAPKKHLTWNWSDITSLRIGKYTAKLVAVYNDGTRDVPVESSVTFWVFPWKILLGLTVVITLIGLGLWTIIRGALHAARRKSQPHHHA